MTHNLASLFNPACSMQWKNNQEHGTTGDKFGWCGGECAPWYFRENIISYTNTFMYHTLYVWDIQYVWWKPIRRWLQCYMPLFTGQWLQSSSKIGCCEYPTARLLPEQTFESYRTSLQLLDTLHTNKMKILRGLKIKWVGAVFPWPFQQSTQILARRWWEKQRRRWLATHIAHQ